MKHDIRSRFLSYFILPSNKSVSVCVSSVIARQRPCKSVTAVTNILATIEELWNVSFFAVRVVSKKVLYLFFFSELVKYCDTVTNQQFTELS